MCSKVKYIYNTYNTYIIHSISQIILSVSGYYPFKKIKIEYKSNEHGQINKI